MKAPSPAFSFYPKDVFSDEHCQAMKHSEFGMYVRLLCHCWLEGSIPSDPVRLQRMLKVSHKTFAASWPAISPCFSMQGERLIQLRLEVERDRQMSRSLNNSERGRKGGRPLESTKEESRGFSAGKPEESLPFPSPFPSPIPGKVVESSVPVKASVKTLSHEPPEKGNTPTEGKFLDAIECPSCGRAGYLSQSTGRNGHPPGFWCRNTGGCGINYPINYAPILDQMTPGARAALATMVPAKAQNRDEQNADTFAAVARKLEAGMPMILGKA